MLSHVIEWVRFSIISPNLGDHSCGPNIRARGRVELFSFHCQKLVLRLVDSIALAIWFAIIFYVSSWEKEGEVDCCLIMGAEASREPFSVIISTTSTGAFHVAINFDVGSSSCFFDFFTFLSFYPSPFTRTCQLYTSWSSHQLRSLCPQKVEPTHELVGGLLVTLLHLPLVPTKLLHLMPLLPERLLDRAILQGLLTAHYVMEPIVQLSL